MWLDEKVVMSCHRKRESIAHSLATLIGLIIKQLRAFRQAKLKDDKFLLRVICFRMITDITQVQTN